MPRVLSLGQGRPLGRASTRPPPRLRGGGKTLRRFKWKPDKSGQKGRATREDLGSQAGAGEASGGRTDPIKRGSGMRLTSSFLSQVFFFLPGLSGQKPVALVEHGETERKKHRGGDREGCRRKEGRETPGGKGTGQACGSSGEQRSRCRTGRGGHQVRSGRGRRGRELHRRGGQPPPCGGKRAPKSGEPRGLSSWSPESGSKCWSEGSQRTSGPPEDSRFL